MDAQIIGWLSALSDTVFRVSATLFVLLNAAAVGVVMLKRDRSIVQRWTSPWLAANLLLIGAGAGVPVVAGIVKLAVSAVAGKPVVEQTQPLATKAQTTHLAK